jgi:hypothetical protein
MIADPRTGIELRLFLMTMAQGIVTRSKFCMAVKRCRSRNGGWNPHKPSDLSELLVRRQADGSALGMHFRRHQSLRTGPEADEDKLPGAQFGEAEAA